MAPLIATTLLACLLAYFLSYILYSTPTAQNHTLAIHLIFTGYYWSMSNLRYTCLGLVVLLYPVSLQATPCHQKSQRKLSTRHKVPTYPLAIGPFQSTSLLSRGWVGWWVVIIKLKANLSSTGTGLPTGTELGNKRLRIRISSVIVFIFDFHPLSFNFFVIILQ